MTYEEAASRIEKYKRIHHMSEHPHAALITEALDMAIDLLYKQVELDADIRWELIFNCPSEYGGSSGDEYGWVCYCPTCGVRINDFTTLCECGQHIVKNKKYPKVEF